jgi:hypothetical protein
MSAKKKRELYRVFLRRPGYYDCVGTLIDGKAEAAAELSRVKENGYVDSFTVGPYEDMGQLT